MNPKAIWSFSAKQTPIHDPDCLSGQHCSLSLPIATAHPSLGKMAWVTRMFFWLVLLPPVSLPPVYPPPCSWSRSSKKANMMMAVPHLDISDDVVRMFGAFTLCPATSHTSEVRAMMTSWVCAISINWLFSTWNCHVSDFDSWRENWVSLTSVPVQVILDDILTFQNKSVCK